MYSETDIIKSLKIASREITDDCSWSGAIILAEIILDKSEDSIMEMIDDLKIKFAEDDK